MKKIKFNIIFLLILAAAISQAAVSRGTIEMKRRIQIDGANRLFMSIAVLENINDAQAAFGLLFLDQDNETANENLQTALAEISIEPENGDLVPQMFWWVRAYYLFSCEMNDFGKISEQTEDAFMRLFEQFVSAANQPERAETGDIWLVKGDEINDICKIINLYLAAQALSQAGENQEFTPIKTLWSKYLAKYTQARAANGLFATVSSADKGCKLLANLTNLYDFTSDELVKKRTSALLDLFWADWAQDSLQLTRYGARSQTSAATQEDGIMRFALPFISPDMNWTQGHRYTKPEHKSIYAAATTGWQMPDVVMDMIIDSRGMGEIEYISQIPAVAEKTAEGAYRLTPELGMLKRYSYRTNSFVLGAFLPDPSIGICGGQNKTGYLPSTAENSIQGLNLANGEYVAIRSNNGLPQAIQKKNLLILQQPQQENQTQQLLIEISEGLKESLSERSGWLVFESNSTRIAVKGLSSRMPGASCGYEWINQTTFTLKEPHAPLVILAAAFSQYRELNDFIYHITDHNWRLRDGFLRYEFADTRQEVEFTMHIDGSAPPTANGREFGSSDFMLLSSPYIRSAAGTGVITVEKGARRVVYNTQSDRIIGER